MIRRGMIFFSPSNMLDRHVHILKEDPQVLILINTFHSLATKEGEIQFLMNTYLADAFNDLDLNIYVEKRIYISKKTLW